MSYYDIPWQPPQQGWQCPKCGTIYAPFVMQCWKCSSPLGVTTQNPDSTGEKPGDEAELQALRELREAASLLDRAYLFSEDDNDFADAFVKALREAQQHGGAA